MPGKKSQPPSVIQKEEAKGRISITQIYRGTDERLGLRIGNE